MVRLLLFKLFLLFQLANTLAQPVFTIQNKKDACDGLNNGSFEILVMSANTPPLRAFIFGPPDQGPYNLTVGVPFLVSGLPGLPGGKTYLVVVQDSDGSSIQFVTIFAVSPDLSASVSSSTNNSSCAAPDGAIDITVTGGTGSYSYQWSGPPGFVDPGTQDLSGLAGGNYSVLIRDNGTNCTRTLGPITITDPSPAIQNVTTPSPQVVCPGNDATIALAATQPAPVTYQVLVNGNPVGIPQSNPAAPGPFVLTVPWGSFSSGDVLTVQAVDGFCTPVLMNGSVTLLIQNLSISSGVTPNSRCTAPFNGAIDITVSGAIGSLSYNWTGPGGPYTTEDLTAVEHGSYTVLVTDNSTGCTTSANINVPDARPSLTLSSSVTDNSRCVAPYNGAIDLTVGGSAGPFTYAWTGPGGPYSTEDLSNIQDGTYSVTVTDVPSGCTVSANIVVGNTAPVLTLSSVETPNSRCVAPYNGAIDLTVGGSAGPFTYAWTGPGGPYSTEDLSNIQDGTYSVTVTDVPSGCTVSANIVVGNTAPVLTLSSVVTPNSRCVAPYNGAIDLTVGGSAGPFTYAWTGPGGPYSTEDLSNIQDGTYSVTVTDVPSGCTVSANIVVGNTAPVLTLSSVETPNSRCVAPYNGAIDLTVGGSAGPFTYAWTGPGGPYSTEDLSNIQDGTYSVTVTDVPSGCTVSANIVVGNTAPVLTLSSVETPNSRCVAPYNGAIDLTVGGSAGPFTYAWTGPGGPYSTEDLSNIQDGTYSVTVTDVPSGCTVSANIVVGNTAPVLTLSSVETPNSRCVAPYNGAIDLTVGGSAGPFTYAWTGPGGPYSTEDLSNIQDGTYSVTVTDVPSGCTVSANIVVGNTAPVLTLSSVETPNSRCVAPYNGAIDLTVGGSAGPFTYAWTGPGGPYSTEDLSNIQDGTYSVTVTDVPSGCTVSANIVVGNTAPVLTLSSVETPNSRCVAPYNGAIDLTVGGSAGPFTYAWTGPGGPYSTEDLSNIQDGTYSVTVTDVPSGCTVSANIVVGNTAPVLTLSSVETPNSRCVAPYNGAIDLTVGGSAGPFTYAWTGPGGPYSTEDLSNIQDGTYSVTVTDVPSGCTVSANIVVGNTAPVLTLSSVETPNSRCVAPYNGAIDLTVGGSAGPFTYAWTGPGGPYSTEDLSNIQDGTYSVTVTDVPSGCTVSANIVVGNTAPVLTLSSVVTPNSRCVAPYNGAIDLTVGGSAGPFTYAWTGPGGPYSTEDLSNIQDGTYSVTVTDVPSGCTVSANIVVNDGRVIPSLNANVIDNDRCNAPFNGAILLTVSPAGSYTFNWTGPGGFTSSLKDITSLAPGLYTVVVTHNVTGCQATEAYTVGNNAPVINITLDAIGPNSSCTPPYSGFILVSVSPAGTYSYSWTGPGGFTASTEDLSGLQEGNYTLTATNTGLGCSATATFVVGDATPTISIVSQTITDNSNCQPPYNGSISITAGGTPGPYTFSWTGPGGFTGSGSSITGLQSGTYTVVITDQSLNCEDVYVFTVGDATPPITITLDSSTPNTNCVAPFTGALSISVTGTPGPFTYAWTGPGGFSSTSEDISAVENGDYTVTVTDTGLGCVATENFTIADGRPTVTINAVSITPNSSCTPPFTGSISQSGGGTPGPFSYSWTGPSGFTSTSQNITALQDGDYTVTITDQVLGCVGIFTLNVPSTAPAVTITQIVVGNTNCNAPFNGSIDITPGGTPGPFTYAWSGPGGFSASTEDISSLEAGNYVVVVTDVLLGCSGSFNINVPQNASTVNISLVSITPNSNCLAPFNGAIDVTIGGTPGPFTINWTGPGGFSASTEDISGLRPGNYTINVQDDLLGCTGTATFTVSNVATGCGGLGCLAFTVTSVETRPSCAVQDDGQITFTISGGTPNYIVTLTDSVDFWVSKPGAGPDFTFTNLSPANYYYIIQDASFPSPNVCALPYSLPVQTNVQATASGFVDALCFGQAMGEATLTVTSGGASPYEYSIDAGITWVTFTSPHTITNLPPNGTYSILVRDDASDTCPAEVSVTINNANPQIQQPLSVVAATCDNNDGKIVLTNAPSGGTGGPYSYLLNGNPVTPVGGEFAGLAAGNYMLSVVDNSGCQRNYALTITFPGYVNTSPIVVSHPDCASGGTNGSISFNILDAGTFFFSVTTDPLYVPGPADYLAVGGTFVFIPGLINGTYYVWVRSSGSQCATRLGPVSVQGVYRLQYNLTPGDEICRGDGGTITLTGITGAPGLDFGYEWVSGGSPATGTITFLESLGAYTISGLAPGSYQFRLTQDQTSLNGCVVSTAYQSVLITGPSDPLGFLALENITESYPDQPTGGMIVVIQESGEEPYELRVELTDPVFPGQVYVRDFQQVNRNSASLRMEERFINLYAGVYVLTVRDALGCVRTTEIEIPVDVDIFIPNIFTPNGDGVNDVFFIRNLPQGSKLVITNRWGNQVFQSSNYPVNANDPGLWNGGNQPDGVYYYRLQAGGRVFNGWVEILRGSKP